MPNKFLNLKDFQQLPFQGKLAILLGIIYREAFFVFDLADVIQADFPEEMAESAISVSHPAWKFHLK